MTIYIQKLILIFVRVTSFIFLTPAFSYQGLPNVFKLVLSVGFSWLIYMTLPELALIGSGALFTYYIVKEFMVGLALGYVSKLVFGLVEMAGQLVDFQAGFSMASVYDPAMGGQAANFGKIYYWTSISIFFILDLHHSLIESFIKSFDYIPLTEFEYSRFGIAEIIDIFSHIFILAFQLAIPMIIMALVTDIVLGLISRSIPQINVLMLGMPMKAMLAFILSLFIMPWLIERMGENLSLLGVYIEKFSRILGGG